LPNNYCSRILYAYRNIIYIYGVWYIGNSGNIYNINHAHSKGKIDAKREKRGGGVFMKKCTFMYIPSNMVFVKITSFIYLYIYCLLLICIYNN
jgi:hypothetical protein